MMVMVVMGLVVVILLSVKVVNETVAHYVPLGSAIVNVKVMVRIVVI